MTKEEFQKHIGELRDVYGAKYYPDARASRMYASLKDFDNEIVSRAISEIVANVAQAPMLEKITEAIEAMRAQQYARQQRYQPSDDGRPKCSQCDGTGAVLAQHNDNGALWVFACGCSAGQARNYPRWSGTHAAHMELLSKSQSTRAGGKSASELIKTAVGSLKDIPDEANAFGW